MALVVGDIDTGKHIGPRPCVRAYNINQGASNDNWTNQEETHPLSVNMVTPVTLGEYEQLLSLNDTALVMVKQY